MYGGQISKDLLEELREVHSALRLPLMNTKIRCDGYGCRTSL